MADRPELNFPAASVSNFRVTWGVQPPSVFQEATGLEDDIATLNRRLPSGNGGQPTSAVAGNVTLRRGLVAADDRLWNWFRAAAGDAVIRSVVLIDLVDEDGTPLMTWMLKNAWPTQLIATHASSSAAPVAVEAIVFAFEAISITSG
jgi:phage tail-like protein